MSKKMKGGRGAGDSESSFIPLIPRSINPDNDTWEDWEFIKASEATKDLNFPELLEYIYTHSNYYGLFQQIEKVIDGCNYKYGLNPDSSPVANFVSEFYIPLERDRIFSMFETDLIFRLNKCQEIEQLSFLENESLYINENVLKYKVKSKYFLRGYSAQKSKRFNFSYIIDIFKNPEENRTACYETAFGAAFYIFEMEILKITKETSIENISSKQKEDIKEPRQTLNAPTIALFCTIVNSSGVIHHSDESKDIFCKKVCERFNIRYTDNIRKNYINTHKLTDITRNKNLEKVKSLILCNIPETERKQIETYLNSENKLYA